MIGSLSLYFFNIIYIFVRVCSTRLTLSQKTETFLRHCPSYFLRRRRRRRCCCSCCFSRRLLLYLLINILVFILTGFVVIQLCLSGACARERGTRNQPMERDVRYGYFMGELSVIIMQYLNFSSSLTSLVFLVLIVCTYQLTSLSVKTILFLSCFCCIVSELLVTNTSVDLVSLVPLNCLSLCKCMNTTSLLCCLLSPNFGSLLSLSFYRLIVLCTLSRG